MNDNYLSGTAHATRMSIITDRHSVLYLITDDLKGLFSVGLMTKM